MEAGGESRNPGRVSPMVHAISAPYQKAVDVEIANMIELPTRTAAEFGGSGLLPNPYLRSSELHAACPPE